jgi:hypothetical protein
MTFNLFEFDPAGAVRPDRRLRAINATSISSVQPSQSQGPCDTSCADGPAPSGSPYFNTTGLRGPALKGAREKALTQDESVARLFEAMPTGFSASPEQVQRKVLPGAPITSVRRSMTTLTQRGVLVKTDTMRTGQYGRPVHTWRAA